MISNKKIYSIPTVTQSSGDTGDNRNTSNLSIHKVFKNQNLGNDTFLTVIPIFDFFSISKVANKEEAETGELIAQRNLDLNHAKKLAVYILKGMVSSAIEQRKQEGKTPLNKLDEIQTRLGKQPYLSLQPIVVNIRNSQNINLEQVVSKNGTFVCSELKLSKEQNLWVIDGQHRRKAMELIFEFLNTAREKEKYPIRSRSLYPYEKDAVITSQEELLAWDSVYASAKSFCTVAVEIHFALSVEEERQLFHDLNNLGKRVEKSLSLEFDNGNPINTFIKNELEAEILDWDVVQKDIVDWQEDTGVIPRKDIVSINAILFLNKGNISGATPPKVDPKKDTVRRFWKTVQNIPHLGVPGAKIKTVAAQPVVLKALAKLVYNFAWSKYSNDSHLEKLLIGIDSIDFSHSNPMWKYYLLTEGERNTLELSDLTDYLPSDDEGYNRDIGGFDPQTGVMRFGMKHNDIFPIIGDMIRWKLGLPKRSLQR
tara:strand:+ start:938 stop:2383 length:1446 start_codon:yes stop_codon:yes gene_type:complete